MTDVGHHHLSCPGSIHEPTQQRCCCRRLGRHAEHLGRCQVQQAGQRAHTRRTLHRRGLAPTCGRVRPQRGCAGSGHWRRGWQRSAAGCSGQAAAQDPGALLPAPRPSNLLGPVACMLPLLVWPAAHCVCCLRPAALHVVLAQCLHDITMACCRQLPCLQILPHCTAPHASQELLLRTRHDARQHVAPACSHIPATHQPSVLLQGHTDRLGRVAFHPMGRHLATASFDMTWRLWDCESGECLLEQEGHSRGVYAVAFQQDGALAGSVGLDAIGGWAGWRASCMLHAQPVVP